MHKKLTTPTSLILWLIAALLLFRIAYAALFPLDLVPDEAYYWDWSRKLDWGYYSKPPLIAWLIGVSTWLGGSSEFWVRLPSVLLSCFGLWWIYCLGERTYNTTVGLTAAILCALTPGNAVLGVIMTIDAPLLFCWSFGLFSAWQMLSSEQSEWKWALWTAAATGAGLLAKQTMIAMPAAIWLFVLVSGVTNRQDRRRILRPQLWVATLGGLIFLTPVLIWNSHHDWIMFQHTSDHFATRSQSLAGRLSVTAEFVLGQLGVMSPVTCVGVALVMMGLFRSIRRLERRELFLLSASGAPLMAVFSLSLLRKVNPNWPAPFYLAGFVLLAAWLRGAIQDCRIPVSADRLAIWKARALRRCVIVGTICVLLTYAAPFGFAFGGLRGMAIDPTIRLRGWQELADEFSALPEMDERLTIIAATSRQEVSELAFYLPHQPDVFHWRPGRDVRSQYDIWGGPARFGDALILTSNDSKPHPRLAGKFERVSRLREIRIDLGSDRQRSYTAWLGKTH